MAKVRKLTVGKEAYTTNGSVVVVVSQQGEKVTVKDVMFSTEMVLNLDEVYHSRGQAWGANRAI